MNESNAVKRVTCKRPRPNQHLQELLESLYREALVKRKDLVPDLKEAILSLEKYPLPLSSGAECAILKGFDNRLCKYIDAHINGQNKKTKVTNNENFICGQSGSRLPPSVEDSTVVMAAASKKGQKKIKTLITNLEKCPFTSNFGEPFSSSRKVSHVETPIVSTNSGTKIVAKNPKMSKNNPANKTSKSGEKNNNTPKSNCIDEACTISAPLDSYFISESKKDVTAPINAQKTHDFLDDVDLALCENWDSITSNECDQFRSKYNANMKNYFQPILVTDATIKESSSSDNSVTEINSSSEDESISQPTVKQRECAHTEEVAACKQCESITTAADAFQLYYKDKMKKDAEEIEKCVLPRKMYKPAYRSGAYAILVALLEQRDECPYRDCLTKEELIQKAQKHTDQSFTTPKPESNYTAWTNTKRLISKGMIQITNYDNYVEDFYKLTGMGRAVAMELVKDHTPKVTINDVIFHGQRNDRVPSLEDVVLVPPPRLGSIDEDQSSVFIEMPPGTFDIVMLIDKREHFNTRLLSSPNNYVKYESRCLTIGDFLWVARSKKTGQELVLPYIVERKRMDDLWSSIKDGRFHEQKFRLRKCGLKHVMYLVESCIHKMRNQQAYPNSTLHAITQAVVNTCVQDEFNVIKTGTVDHTFKFLGLLSESLVHEFLPIFLRGCNRDTQGKELMTFEFFNKYSSKNKPLTVKDTFIKMLLQLRGLSVEKALAITHKYSTPRALMKAYDRCTEREGELLLATLKLNSFTRNVGPAVSKTVYHLFSKLEI